MADQPRNNLVPFLSDHVRPVESVESQLRSAMQAVGIEPPATLELDGQIHRFATSQKPGDDSGWYVIYPDNIAAGAFGDWRTGTTANFVANMGRALTAIEQMQNAQRVAEAKRRHEDERRIKHEKAAETCQAIWDNAGAAGRDHPYLARKGISPHVARIAPDGRLIVPLYSFSGELSSLQYISADGEKKYHPGGAVKGAHCLLGAIGTRLYIAEGYATGATIHETTDHAVAIAYSAGQLEAVTGYFRALYPAIEIVIVADNDASGVGKNYADQAAAKHGATVIIPPELGDANDYRQSGHDLRQLLEPSPAIERLKVIFGNELPEAYEAPDEVIQGLVVAGSQTVIYGDSNSGKTFFALAMARSVSDGQAFFSRQVDKGIVLYLATEAPASIRARMQALKRFHSSSLSNLAMVPVPLNFYSNYGDALDVVRLVSDIETRKKQRVRMIIADTLARMSAGANENSGEDMGPVMERFSLVAAQTGAAVVIIHHNGKDTAKGARGWSGIRAHIDTEIEVEESDGLRFAKVTKQRELASKGDEITFELAIVAMGTSKFGADVTTCVAVQSDENRPKKIDRAAAKRIKMIKDGWEFCGMEFIQDQPYISRSGMRRFLMEKHEMGEEVVRKNLQPSEESRLVGALLIAGVITPKDNGWIIVLDDVANVCRLMKSGENR